MLFLSLTNLKYPQIMQFKFNRISTKQLSWLTFLTFLSERNSYCVIVKKRIYNNNNTSRLTFDVSMSQGIAEIRHFRKSLGISGNAQAIEEILELPRHLQKLQAFPEIPRQLGKFMSFSLLFSYTPKSGKQHSFKIKLLLNKIKLT